MTETYSPLTKTLRHCLVATMNKELTKIQEWFNANKLSLNVQKPNTVFFSSTGIE